MAVTEGQVAVNAITATKIANGAVGTNALATSGITSSKLAVDSVTTVAIVNGAVTVDKIADATITTAKLNIADGTVLGSKIASGTITGTQISTGGVGNANLASNAVTSIKIAASGIGSGKLAASSVATDNLIDSSVTAVKVATGAIGTAQLAASGVTAAKIAGNSVSIVQANAPIGNGSFVGQKWFDDSTKFEYTWDGATWERQAAINTLTVVDSTPIDFAISYPDNFSATITTTLASQNSNTVFAGLSSGTTGTPAFRSLVSADLPIATSGSTGAARPGAGLLVDAAGQFNHSNSAAPGTYAGSITIDSEGHIVTAQTSLVAADIPFLDASIITTGTFGSGVLGTNCVGADQLADYGIAQISESAPDPQFAGQWWINPNDRAAYIWVGSVSPTIDGHWLNLGYGSPTQINLRFGGTYNASTNLVESINNYGIESALTVGQALSAPSTSNNGLYLIVTASGVGTNPAPAEPLQVGDWVLSQGIGANWTQVDLGSSVTNVPDQDVLVNGAGFTPVASGIANQESMNQLLWTRSQLATSSSIGIVRGSSEIVVAATTGIMSIGTIDDGTY